MTIPVSSWPTYYEAIDSVGEASTSSTYILYIVFFMVSLEHYHSRTLFIVICGVVNGSSLSRFSLLADDSQNIFIDDNA